MEKNPTKLNIVSIQLGGYKGSYSKQINHIQEMINESVINYNPDLILLPELMTVPYFSITRDPIFFKLSETIQGPTVKRMLAIAKEMNVYIIFTIFERRKVNKNFKYFNTAVIVSPEKVVGTYSKTHIPQGETPTSKVDERYYFQADNTLPVFKVKGITIGILICYDRSFPEAARTLSLQGAQILFIPSCTLREREIIWIEECKARARENEIFVIGANRGGEEKLSLKDQQLVRHYCGSSLIINPDGEILKKAPFNIGDKSISSKIDSTKNGITFKKDRRPELYKIE